MGRPEGPGDRKGLDAYNVIMDAATKLAIFDLDGVIVSTDAFHYQAWGNLARRNGWFFDEELNHRLRGVSRSESLAIIMDANGAEASDHEISLMLEEKNAGYRELLNELTPGDILPGVTELLADLDSSGILSAIGSSSRNTPLILEKIGLSDAFDTVVDGNAITNSKPHPEVFLKGAEALGVDPADSVVFEDAQAGVDAARAAGMKVVGVGGAGLSGADALFPGLKDVLWSDILQALG